MTENGPKKYLSVQVQYSNFNFRFMFSLKLIFRSNFKKSSFLVFRAMFFRSKDRTPVAKRSTPLLGFRLLLLLHPIWGVFMGGRWGKEGWGDDSSFLFPLSRLLLHMEMGRGTRSRRSPTNLKTVVTSPSVGFFNLVF